jgi:hypothetical protein
VVAILNLVSGSWTGYCGVGVSVWIAGAHPINSDSTNAIVVQIVNCLKNPFFIIYPPYYFLYRDNALIDKLKWGNEM